MIYIFHYYFKGIVKKRIFFNQVGAMYHFDELVSAKIPFIIETRRFFEWL